MRGGWMEWFGSVFSFIYLAASAVLLVTVCSHCYPAFGQSVREAVAGWEGSSVREAFSVLTDSLEEGEPVKDAFASSVEVLLGEAG